MITLGLALQGRGFPDVAFRGVPPCVVTKAAFMACHNAMQFLTATEHIPAMITILPPVVVEEAYVTCGRINIQTDCEKFNPVRLREALQIEGVEIACSK
ncbi:hypothetical protein LJR034_005285 [Caballeronia sp. LjRoot34]|uniref:hypothetical protein n=1 Tax=Caballeronia sp. LjRoot34 TaxID=3342325 RepID=UPI003ECC213A